MLACHVIWHLRQAWVPLTFTDEPPPGRANPVAPARRSPSADAKASRKTGSGNQPIRSFLDHLATLTRNDLRYGDLTISAPLSNPQTRYLTRRNFGLGISSCGWPGTNGTGAITDFAHLNASA